MSDDLVHVRLLRVPVRVSARVSEHSDALRREFDLIRRSDPDRQETPQRLLELVDELQDRYGGFSVGPRDELLAAQARGEDEIDLEYHVPAQIVDDVRRLLEIFAEADAYCRAGEHLLTLSSPPEAIAFRTWFLDEFARQAHGQDPTSWPAWLATHPTGPATDGRAARVGRGAHGNGSNGAEHRPPSSQEELTVEGSDDAPVIVVRDDLDLQSGPGLRELLIRLRADGASHITVDLASSRFVDSVGISVLVSAHSRLEADGARLTLVASPSLRQVLRIAGVDDLLDLHDPS